MGDEALSIGADTFQFFSRNPRGSGVRKLDVDDIQALNQLMAAHHFAAHPGPCAVYPERLLEDGQDARFRPPGHGR